MVTTVTVITYMNAHQIMTATGIVTTADPQHVNTITVTASNVPK